MRIDKRAREESPSTKWRRWILAILKVKKMGNQTLTPTKMKVIRMVVQKCLKLSRSSKGESNPKSWVRISMTRSMLGVPRSREIWSAFWKNTRPSWVSPLLSLTENSRYVPWINSESFQKPKPNVIRISKHNWCSYKSSQQSCNSLNVARRTQTGQLVIKVCMTSAFSTS